MPESVSLEELIQESEFLALLEKQGADFFLLVNALLTIRPKGWKKTAFYQLSREADELESFLDDYGAARNRTFHCLRELVASVRWFSLAGLSVSHLAARITRYGITEEVGEDVIRAGQQDLMAVRGFLARATRGLLEALKEEALQRGVSWPRDASRALSTSARPRRRLPRNVGEEVPLDEGQKIAEVASKFLATSEMIRSIGIRRIDDPVEREELLDRVCREEQARVYEATVHNLQSTYDTYIKNSVLETEDARLPKLRGFCSVTLHLLEAVTFLTHFVERHESGYRSELAEERIRSVVERGEIQEIVLNQLLFWADQGMRHGRTIAEELLPAYTNVRELSVELPEDVKLHARPVSLIVGVVARHGTPVEMEIAGKRCNAASILEVLVAVGSSPDARRVLFRGDENPLRDIELLFQHGLGERGLEVLPDQLRYLSE